MFYGILNTPLLPFAISNNFIGFKFAFMKCFIISCERLSLKLKTSESTFAPLMNVFIVYENYMRTFKNKDKLKLWRTLIHLPNKIEQFSLFNNIHIDELVLY